MFFGTPHGGGKDALVTLGNACTRIVTSLSTNPSSDIMQALKSGSLFSDVLQESWRHQLSSYKIISFYEGVGDVSYLLDTHLVFPILPCYSVSCERVVWLTILDRSQSFCRSGTSR